MKEKEKKKKMINEKFMGNEDSIRKSSERGWQAGAGSRVIYLPAKY